MRAGKRELVIGGIAMLAVWTVEAAFLAADREHGLLPWIETRSELLRARSDLADLESQRDSLRVQSTSLAGDWHAIEAQAREELGMVFPGERMLRIPEGERR